MIPKMTSQELTNILSNAKEHITQVNDSIQAIKKDMLKKMLVIKYENEYMAKQIKDAEALVKAPDYNEIESVYGMVKGDGEFYVSSGSVVKNKRIVFVNDCKGSQYESYGSTIHPRTIKAPVNVFNLKVSGTGEIFFRKDATVTVNNMTSSVYQSILKHDSITDKEVFFEEFSGQNVKIAINLDMTNPLGPSRFNMIEIDSFLPGSYDIESIEIYTKNSDGSLNNSPLQIEGRTLKIKRAGKERIVLPNKVEMYRVVFNAKINFSSTKEGNVVYPFGLKHIYFYDADFRTDSYVLATIDTNSYSSPLDPNNYITTYISTIYDEIVIKRPDGDFTSTIETSGIEVYLDNENDVLETQVFPSTVNHRNDIARNVNKIYVKIPLQEPLIAATFKIEVRVQS